MLASDDANREFAGARNPDDVLHVVFYVKATSDNFRTVQEGRPIFRDEEFVKIMIPGRNDLDIDEPARADHKARFPRQWLHFMNQKQEGGKEELNGTPVTEWPLLTRAQAEELRAMKFYTVEQIALCSDAQITSLGMNANMMRQKARAFLETAKGTAHAQELVVENAKKQQQIDDLNRQVVEMNARMEAFMAEKKPGKKAEQVA